MFKLIVIASFLVFGMTNGAIWRTAGPSVDESNIHKLPYIVKTGGEYNCLQFLPQSSPTCAMSHNTRCTFQEEGLLRTQLIVKR